MRYMPIAPVGMFDVIKDERSAFILPQFWDCESYREFYLSHDFDVVIVDNGVYEGAEVEEEEIVRIAREVSTEKVFVTLPEVVGSASRTVMEIRMGLDKYEGVGKMVCLQGRMIEELREFEDVVEDVDAIAVPVSMYRKGWCRGALREWMVKNCEGMRDKYWHAFGCDNLLEMIELKRFGYDSVDTSMPFTAAIHRIDFGINMVVKNVKRVNLLRRKFSVYERQLAEKNLNIIKELVGDAVD